jgi:hypothetical protein
LGSNLVLPFCQAMGGQGRSPRPELHLVTEPFR